MSATRLGLTCAAILVAGCLATPAFAEDWDDLASELQVAPVFPAPADGSDWISCRLGPGATGFVPTQGPYAAPCAPVDCCPQECCPRDCWGFRVGLMGWLPGLDGDLTLAGQDQTVDFDWTDWFDHLDQIDFVLQLWAQVRYQKWHFELAGLRMVLGDSVPIQTPGPLPVAPVLDAELTMVIARGTVGYEFYRKSTSARSPFPCLTGIAFAGARYYSIDVEANLTTRVGGLTVLDETQDWVDPIVGARGVYDLHRQWSVFLEGDIGGFGVGSDFAWHLLGGVEWRVATWFGLQLGWNHLDVDYSTGSGATAFKFDLALSGPFMNFVFSF